MSATVCVCLRLIYQRFYRKSRCVNVFTPIFLEMILIYELWAMSWHPTPIHRFPVSIFSSRFFPVSSFPPTDSPFHPFHPPLTASPFPRLNLFKPLPRFNFSNHRTISPSHPPTFYRYALHAKIRYFYSIYWVDLRIYIPDFSLYTKTFYVAPLSQILRENQHGLSGIKPRSHLEMWDFLFCQFDFPVSGSNIPAKTQGAASLCKGWEI